jgi:hypothetical protein
MALSDESPACRRSWRLAEEVPLQKYGHEYLVVIQADIDPGQECLDNSDTPSSKTT